MPSEAPSGVPSVTPVRRAPSSRSALKWVIMLGALACLPALTVDMYLPALPQVASDLGASDTLAQLTVSCMLVGGALGQLVIGPLTDRFGRRLPLMIGIGMHVLVSLACAVVDDVHVLIGLRLVQGFFNSAASVAAMATVRDRFVGAEAARILSRLMLVIGVAPMLAPSLGSIVLEAFDWRWIFVVLALIGATLAVIVFFVMPETNPVARRTTGGASSVAARLPHPAPRPALHGARPHPRPRHGRGDELRGGFAVRVPAGLRPHARAVLAAVRHQRPRPGALRAGERVAGAAGRSDPAAAHGPRGAARDVRACCWWSRSRRWVA